MLEPAQRGDKTAKRYFTCVPQGHLLYLLPPACCRHRSLINAAWREDGNISFLVLEEGDIALGNFEQVIGDAIEQLLAHLPERPKAFHLCYTCVHLVVGAYEQGIIDALERRFEGMRFGFFPIHHLSRPSGIAPPEDRELSLYKPLTRAMPKTSDVNVIDGRLALDESSEMYLTLRDCGVGKIRQELALESFEDYEAMAGAQLNLLFGRMGVPTCELLEERFGTPWLHAHETYRLDLLLDELAQVSRWFGREPLDFTERAGRCRELGARAAEAFAGHPLVVGESCSVSTADLSRALIDYGFEVIGLESHFKSELKSPELARLREEVPDFTVIDDADPNPRPVTAQTVVLSNTPVFVEGAFGYCYPTSHALPWGIGRIEHLLNDLLLFAEVSF